MYATGTHMEQETYATIQNMLYKDSIDNFAIVLLSAVDSEK